MSQQLNKRQFSIIEKIASTFIHTVILEAIKPLTNENLEKLIDRNENLFDIFAKRISSQNIRKIAEYLWMFKPKISQYATYEEVMYQFREHRPDLTILETPKGQEFLKKQVKILRDELRKQGLID